jgi:putative DNA primase/helicase
MLTALTLARSLHARKVGSGWMAKCPAHEDNNTSLAIREKDGKVLVHCHAGCDQREVIDALRRLGLWESEPQQCDSRIVATYDYTDQHGELLYQVIRKEPKAFLQRRPDGHGGWTWRKGERQVLYRLREVLAAPIVFIVEGEKDVETLRAWGFVATTNAGGAKAPWLPSFTQTLRGHEAIIVPDNDTPGWQRAAVIAEALLNVAARIVIFDLPQGVKDISDWFASHSETELIAQLEGVNAV